MEISGKHYDNEISFGMETPNWKQKLILLYTCLFLISNKSMPMQYINTWSPRQNGHHVPDDISECIFSNDYIWIAIKIWLLKFAPEGPINIPALLQIMAWRRPGDKPLSEPMMDQFIESYMFFGVFLIECLMNIMMTWNCVSIYGRMAVLSISKWEKC